jgi:hypothetical protein
VASYDANSEASALSLESLFDGAREDAEGEREEAADGAESEEVDGRDVDAESTVTGSQAADWECLNADDADENEIVNAVE